VGSSKAANRAVNRVVSRNRRNRVSKLRRPDAKAVSKAVVANKVDNKAVSRAHKIVRLFFSRFRKEKSPGASPGDFYCAVWLSHVLNNIGTDIVR
jgi:hypothetical protein